MASNTDAIGAGSSDVWVMKLRPDGTIEWQKAYWEMYFDSPSSIRQTTDGGYIVAGHLQSLDDIGGDFWLLKLRSDRGVEWQKTYGGNEGSSAPSVQQTADGGYIVAGVTWPSGGGDKDIWVLKLRPDGDVEWQKTYGESGRNWTVNSIQQTRDGGYIMAGDTEPFDTEDADGWVFKLFPDGTVEWQKAYGRALDDGFHSIRQTSDGGYIAAGSTHYSGNVGVNIWLLKLGPDGAVEWEKVHVENYDSSAYSVKPTVDGGYVATGWIVSPGTKDDPTTDLFVLKLGPDGSLEWQKAYKEDYAAMGDSIQQTSDGGYVVAGWTVHHIAEFENVYQLWVLKLRPDGSLGPSCDLITDTNLSVKDSTATVRDTGAGTSDTNVEPRDSSALVLDTNVPAHILCP